MRFWWQGSTPASNSENVILDAYNDNKNGMNSTTLEMVKAFDVMNSAFDII